MKIELTNDKELDCESLSFQTSHLLKATTVALAAERARAILQLEKNIREHHVQADIPTQVQSDYEE